MSVDVNEVYTCLLKHNFHSVFTQNNFKLTYKDRRLFEFVKKFVKEKCNIEIPIETPNTEWNKIYKQAVKPIAKGELNKNVDNQSEAGIITPASAIYLALFEIYGYSSPERMYQILEQILVEKLSGKDNNAELLFYPVTEERLKAQIQLVKQVISKEPSICKVPFFMSAFCSKTKVLSKSFSKRCLLQLRRVCLEVEKNG